MLKHILTVGIFCFCLCACTTAPIEQADPATAQSAVQQAWSAAQHGTWQLDWAQMPLYGPVIFEAWLTEDGQKRRFEILESPAPALVGMAYVCNGETAQIYNRLQPESPVYGSAELPFAPVSDAFNAITRFLTGPIQSAQQESTLSETRITFTNAAAQTLHVRQNSQTGLIFHAKLSGSDVDLTLTARSQEPLPNPHPNLFQIKQ